MNVTTSSNTPVSVTQTLSALRLTHARLLEDHGANLALLRQREADVSDAERRATDLAETVDTLESEINEAKKQVGRREQRVLLAEREAAFLQALVVRCFDPFLVNLTLRFLTTGELQRGKGGPGRQYNCRN